MIAAPIRCFDEFVLIAEDDPLVRAAAVRFVCGAGFQAIAVENGMHAVEVFRKRGRGIRAVVLDIIMPKMNGREAYEIMRRIHPRVHAVFCTGYDPDEAQTKTLTRSGLIVIQKPFAGDRLISALALGMDRRSQRAMRAQPALSA